MCRVCMVLYIYFFINTKYLKYIHKQCNRVPLLPKNIPPASSHLNVDTGWKKAISSD